MTFFAPLTNNPARMKLYRKVIPKVAKDIVRSLLANRAIEVEDGHRDEAELDIAAVLVEYLNAVDQVSTDATEAMQRHNFTHAMLGKVKKSIADQRKVIIGEETEEHLVGRVIDALFNSRHIEEVFVEDHELRKLVTAAMRKYVGVDEELDREVRGRLKNLREGTAEWEIEYGRLIEQMRSVKQA
ncbi:MAG: DUF507 family protein [Clostridia bacterium]|nr:DUF507 family protein [Deltaproteobacteria bacterium]